MAGPYICRNADGAPTNDSGTTVPTFAVSCGLIVTPAQTSTLTEAPAPTQALAHTPASAPVSVPGPPGRYTDEDLQRVINLALKLFLKNQEHGQLQPSFKTKDPITWEEFKDFLLKNLEDDWVFANSIFNQFRRISQHQQKSILE